MSAVIARRLAQLALVGAFLSCAVAQEQAPRVTDLSSDKWVTDSSVDRMTGKSANSASIWSKEKINLPRPYQGEQPIILNLGRNSSGQAFVLFGVVSGQFWCSDCDIRIRFDDGEAELWSATVKSPQTKFLLLRSPERFIKKLSGARRILVELPFYNFGSVPLEFSAEGMPYVL